MTAVKPRHLHSVPTTPAADVASLHATVVVLAERRAQFAYQHQHAKAASQVPDVIADRDRLIAKTAHRIKQQGADVRALLAELADAMYVTGHMDASAEDQPGLTDATLATIIKIEDIERQIRQEAEPKGPVA